MKLWHQKHSIELVHLVYLDYSLEFYPSFVLTTRTIFPNTVGRSLFPGSVKNSISISLHESLHSFIFQRYMSSSNNVEFFPIFCCAPTAKQIKKIKKKTFLPTYHFHSRFVFISLPASLIICNQSKHRMCFTLKHKDYIYEIFTSNRKCE